MRRKERSPFISFRISKVNLHFFSNPAHRRAKWEDNENRLSAHRLKKGDFQSFFNIGNKIKGDVDFTFFANFNHCILAFERFSNFC